MPDKRKPGRNDEAVENRDVVESNLARSHGGEPMSREEHEREQIQRRRADAEHGDRGVERQVGRFGDDRMQRTNQGAEPHGPQAETEPPTPRRTSRQKRD